MNVFARRALPVRVGMDAVEPEDAAEVASREIGYAVPVYVDPSRHLIDQAEDVHRRDRDAAPSLYVGDGVSDFCVHGDHCSARLRPFIRPHYLLAGRLGEPRSGKVDREEIVGRDRAQRPVGLTACGHLAGGMPEGSDPHNVGQIGNRHRRSGVGKVVQQTTKPIAELVDIGMRLGVGAGGHIEDVVGAEPYEYEVRLDLARPADLGYCTRTWRHTEDQELEHVTSIH